MKFILNKTENPSKDALDKIEILQSSNYANCDQTLQGDQTDQTDIPSG